GRGHVPEDARPRPAGGAGRVRQEGGAEGPQGGGNGPETGDGHVQPGRGAGRGGGVPGGGGRGELQRPEAVFRADRVGRVAAGVRGREGDGPVTDGGGV